MTAPQSLWDRIDLSIRKKGWNQAQLAEKTGVSRTAITDIKNGKSKAGSILGRLAEALDVPPMWLRDGAGNAPSWAKADEVGRTFDEIADLHARKEAGDPMAEVLWEVRKLRAEVAALRAEVAASRPAPAPDAVTASLVESERILSGA